MLCPRGNMLTNIRFRLIGPSQMLNFNGLLVLSFALLIAMAGAHQFRVGGQMGWSLPTDHNAMSYNQWAEQNRFQIGDSLLFVYQPNQDSVLQVDKDAYNDCNTSSFISKFDDGNTVFTFTRSGPFYFISGVDNNCKRNESLVVVVMADRSKSALGTNQSSPSPSPTPQTEAPPPPLPPPPTAPLSPPPPPLSSSMEAPPSPAPTEQESYNAPPPPNGVPVKDASLMCSVGVVIGLLLFVRDGL